LTIRTGEAGQAARKIGRDRGTFLSAGALSREPLACREQRTTGGNFALIF